MRRRSTRIGARTFLRTLDGGPRHRLRAPWQAGHPGIVACGWVRVFIGHELGHRRRVGQDDEQFEGLVGIVRPADVLGGASKPPSVVMEHEALCGWMEVFPLEIPRYTVHSTSSGRRFECPDTGNPSSGTTAPGVGWSIETMIAGPGVGWGMSDVADTVGGGDAGIGEDVGPAAAGTVPGMTEVPNVPRTTSTAPTSRIAIGTGS